MSPQQGLDGKRGLFVGVSSVQTRCIWAPGARQGPQYLSSRPSTSSPGQGGALGRRGLGAGQGPVWSFYHWVGFFITGWDSRSVEEVATPFRPGIFFFSLRWCWPRWLFPEASFPHTAPPGWPGVGMTPPHTHSRGSQALGFLSLSGQAYWRKTALRPSSKQETALPASWRTGTVPMATVGQRGHINPSQGRPGLELLLTNVSGYNATRVTGSQP